MITKFNIFEEINFFYNLKEGDYIQLHHENMTAKIIDITPDYKTIPSGMVTIKVEIILYDQIIPIDLHQENIKSRSTPKEIEKYKFKRFEIETGANKYNL